MLCEASGRCLSPGIADAEERVCITSALFLLITLLGHCVRLASLLSSFYFICRCIL